MKNKAFTLIELLAVIIILGILMLIAIPSVTSYINNSRKESYVSTVQELIKAASTKVNSGELDMYDTDTTYYIPVGALDLENGKAQSPYGDFGEAYIVVTTDGEEYDYYYVGKDNADMGVLKITSDDNLNKNDIVSVTGSINTDTGVGRRSKIVVWNTDLSSSTSKDATSNINGDTGNEIYTTCRRATTLHTTECLNTYLQSCNAAGYSVTGIKGTTTITYGQIGISGRLNVGDAFDCDVNDDGTYDSETERFYYVTTSDNAAVLIYYNNVFEESINYLRSSSYSVKSSVLENSEDLPDYFNYLGPITAVKHLPSVDTWKNKGLKTNFERNIVNEKGDKQASTGTIVDSFEYTDKAARFLTFQEVINACGDGDYLNEGYLDNKCTFMLENTYFENGNYTTYKGAYGARSFGWWLETPCKYNRYVHNSAVVYSCAYIIDYERNVVYTNPVNSRGVRPAIEVDLSNMDY